MANTEAKILSNAFQKARDMTRWYLSMLKTADPRKNWEVNGVKLNSILWLSSHLAWAEQELLLVHTGGKKTGIDWLDHYELESGGTVHNDTHDMRAAIDAMKLVHEKAMQHLLTINDEKMGEENINGVSFGAEKTNRILVQHAIRHEGIHCGHLGWLCKINGVKTI